MKYAPFLTVVLLLQGCIPIPVPFGPYYQPLYPDASATVVRQHCHGGSGPSSGVAFTIEGGIAVRVTTSESSYADRRFRVGIEMELPAGSDVEWLSDRIVFEHEGGRNAPALTGMRVLSSVTADANATFERRLLCPVSEDAAAGKGELPLSYAVRYWNKEPADAGFVPERLELRLPVIVVGGRTVETGPVNLELERRKGDLSYWTPRMRADREARYRECVRTTPDRHCGNILEVYQKGFEIESGDFTITGRVGGWNDSIGVGVDEMTVRTKEAWRYALPEIVLKDTGSGSVQVRSLSGVYAYCGPYEVPFTTFVHAPSGYRHSTVSIRFEAVLDGVSLPSGSTMRLPPLKVNGKRFDFRPIELQLRVLDGEFPPFNC